MGKCPEWRQERRETFGKMFLSNKELIKADPADNHRFPATDWPASGQRQCIAGGAAQQRQQHNL